MFKLSDTIYMNRKVRMIETDNGYTASVYTDYGWHDLQLMYPSKNKCRKALWFYIINS